MVDPELVISEVEKRVVLWDPSSEDYKDKNKKDNAWKEVASSLFETFASKTDAEQKILAQDLEKKWRSIRDNYVRNRRKNNEACKSGSGASKKKKYFYEEQLRFLKKTMELRTTNTSIPEDPTLDNCSVDIQSNGNNSGLENGEESVVEVTPTTSTKRASVNAKRCTRKSNFIEEKLVSFMEAHQPRQDLLIEDEDLSFFKSLLPTVRKLNADKKFTFRMQTMQILQNLQQGTSATIEARPNNFISFPPQHSTASYANTNTNYQPESRPSSTATYFSNFSPSYHSTDDSHSRAEYDRDNPQYSNLDLQ